MLAAVQLLLRVLYSASANMSDGEELWHVLDSALYSSTQMSRYGCDFAALLPPIARKWALRSMSSACDHAIAALRQPWPPSPPSTSSRSFKSQLSLEIPLIGCPAHSCYRTVLDIPLFHTITYPLMTTFLFISFFAIFYS